MYVYSLVIKINPHQLLKNLILHHQFAQILQNLSEFYYYLVFQEALLTIRKPNDIVRCQSVIILPTGVVPMKILDSFLILMRLKVHLGLLILNYTFSQMKIEMDLNWFQKSNLYSFQVWTTYQCFQIILPTIVIPLVFKFVYHPKYFVVFKSFLYFLS